MKAVATDGSLLVTWTATGSPGAFLVHWRVHGTSAWSTELLPATTREYTITGLSASTEYELQVRALVAGELQTETVTTSAVPAPPPPPPVEGSVVWAGDGEKAGPTNNAYLEWAAYSGAEYENGGHPRINLVTAMDAAHGGHPALQGKYMYRHELKPGADAFDNERLELLNEAESYDPALAAGIEAAMEWREGTELWVAHAFYIPASEMGGTGSTKPEVDWSENYYGMLPICQFHGKWGNPPTFDMGISNTREYGGNWMAGKNVAMVPQLNADTYDYKTNTESALWNGGPVKPDTWYKVLWHFKISATDGFVELFVDVGDGAGMVKRGERTNYATLDAEWMFPCMGGPRNEGSKAELIAHEIAEVEKEAKVSGGRYAKAALEAQEPPAVILYHDAWTFATTRAAAEAHAFDLP